MAQHLRDDAPTLLVLAAGLGRRFGGLKQFEPMGPNGETLLDYAVFDAMRAGFSRVVFVIHDSQATALADRLVSRYGGRLRVDYVRQRLDDLPAGCNLRGDRVKPWGTLHAVLSARDTVREPFAVINADDFYGQDAYRQVANFLRAPVSARTDADHYCMVGYPLSHTLSDSGGVNRGICRDEGGVLVAVEEHFDIVKSADGSCRGLNLLRERVELADSDIASMNLWGFTPTVFEPMRRHFAEFLVAHGNDPQAECFIPSVVDKLVRTGQADCRILPTTAQWFGITYPEDKPASARRLLALIEDGIYPNALWR